MSSMSCRASGNFVSGCASLFFLVGAASMACDRLLAPYIFTPVSKDTFPGVKRVQTTPGSQTLRNNSRVWSSSRRRLVFPGGGRLRFQPQLPMPVFDVG